MRYLAVDPVDLHIVGHFASCLVRHVRGLWSEKRIETSGEIRGRQNSCDKSGVLVVVVMSRREKGMGTRDLPEDKFIMESSREPLGVNWGDSFDDERDGRGK